MTHTVAIVLVQLALAVAFFFIINWLGEHSKEEGYRPLSFYVEPDEAPAFNLVFRTLSPVVYIVLAAAIFYTLHLDWLVTNLYLVPVFYAIVRLLANFLEGQIQLVNWKVRLTSWLSIPISWLVYEHIIKTKQHLFPDLDRIGDELWLAVAVFLYSAFNRIKVSTDNTENRLSRYIKTTYEKFSEDYGAIINQKTADPHIQALIYSIMIYENFNRSKAKRLVENVGFRLGKCKTLGVMQVTTTKMISDLESVGIGADKILRDYNEAYSEAKKRDDEAKEAAKKSNEEYSESVSTSALVYQTTLKYNPSSNYASQVESIYDRVKKDYYPALQDEASDI